MFYIWQLVIVGKCKDIKRGYLFISSYQFCFLFQVWELPDLYFFFYVDATMRYTSYKKIIILDPVLFSFFGRFPFNPLPQKKKSSPQKCFCNSYSICNLENSVNVAQEKVEVAFFSSSSPPPSSERSIRPSFFLCYLTVSRNISICLETCK